MLKRVVTWFLLLPLAFLIAFFALANRQAIFLGVDPISPQTPFMGPYEVPLFIVIYGALLIGVILGGMGAYFTQAKKRLELRKLRKENARLQKQIAGEAPTDQDDALALLDDRL